MRVALDYTPAISQTAGVGRYTRSLFAAMRRQQGADLSWRLWHPSDSEDLHELGETDNTAVDRLPISARTSNMLWHRLGIPLKIERFTGPVSVVHGTDFVVPPSSAPSVVTVHDLSYALLPQLAFPRLQRYLERVVPRSINRARKVIAVSETTKRDLCEYYEISPNRVEVIHHAPDPLFHPPQETAKLAMQAQFGLRRPYFIMVGTIEPRKEHQTLIRAFALVNKQYPETSLVIVGRQGWLSDDIMRTIDEASRSMPVYHLQGINDGMLPALYASSTALVFPSRYEGFGLPLLEAMACGTPVIASETPAHREVAGDAAMWASVQDAEAMAGHMVAMLKDDDLRHDLIQKGFERAFSFTWDHAAAEHIRVYQEVADG